MYSVVGIRGANNPEKKKPNTFGGKRGTEIVWNERDA